MDCKETTRQRGSQNQNCGNLNPFLKSDSVLDFRHFAQSGFFDFRLDQPYLYVNQIDTFQEDSSYCYELIDYENKCSLYVPSTVIK